MPVGALFYWLGNSKKNAEPSFNALCTHILPLLPFDDLVADIQTDPQARHVRGQIFHTVKAVKSARA